MLGPTYFAPNRPFARIGTGRVLKDTLSGAQLLTCGVG